nr:immunoglobulin light chain junction region [Macaca mulatta]MOW59169.1 immunoglobulin light chain junction region [Macaca mulatta]MOW59532.1 immunoglobulin light chain junction region [Macaca mulatta]MOW60830.1 immunoglobulin light chain junction region [Macaca mulatta]
DYYCSSYAGRDTLFF